MIANLVLLGLQVISHLAVVLLERLLLFVQLGDGFVLGRHFILKPVVQNWSEHILNYRSYFDVKEYSKILFY